LKLIGERGEVAPFFSLSSFRGVVDVAAVAREEGKVEVVVLDEVVVAEVESLGPERIKATGALCERECVLGFSPASVRERFAVFLSGSFFNRFAAVSGVLLFFIAGNEASLPCALREPFSFSDLTDLRPVELLVSLESSGGSSGNT
jgi:hypothetical protein